MLPGRERWATWGRAARWAPLCALLLLVPTAASAASITLEPSARAITTDDELTLQLRLEGDFDSVQEPSLTDWNVTGTSQQRQIVLGATRTSQVIFTYTLQPRRAGALTIGQARLLSGAQVVAQAGPITIQVAEPKPVDPQAPGQAADVSRHAGEPFFIVPVASEARVYEGQPFVLGFDLWVRTNVRAEARGMTQSPKLAGFATEDLLGGQNPRSNRQIGRHTYVVVTLKRDVLVPLQAGKAIIDPMEMQLAAGDVFIQRTYTVRSEPVEMEVLPLPAEGRPPGFGAANVGQLSIAADLGGHAAGAVGERLVLTVTVEGSGNLAGVKPPTPPAVEGARVDLLPGADTAGIVRDATGIHGAVRFSYVVTPTRPGTLTLPPLTLHSFDPRAGRYVQSSTAPLTVEVARATVEAGASSQEASTLKPIVTGVSLANRAATNGRPSPLVWGLLAAALLGWAAVEARWQLQRRQASQAGALRTRRALTAARAQLRAAEAHMKQGNVREVFSATSAALLQFVEDRFGVAAQGLTHDALRIRLLEAGVPDALAAELVAELENCDFARFAPASTRGDEMRQALERAGRLLGDIDGAARGREAKHAA
ncbi:MAG: hypothetical protein AMXMBFR64_35220 [Myxococcales bacterium]